MADVPASTLWCGSCFYYRPWSEYGGLCLLPIGKRSAVPFRDPTVRVACEEQSIAPETPFVRSVEPTASNLIHYMSLFSMAVSYEARKKVEVGSLARLTYPFIFVGGILAASCSSQALAFTSVPASSRESIRATDGLSQFARGHAARTHSAMTSTESETHVTLPGTVLVAQNFS